MLIYIYDLKIKGKKAYNALKRRFYYRMRKKLPNAQRRTKSVILINEREEKEADEFFNEWEGFIDLYKIKAVSIEKLLEAKIEHK